MIERRVFRAMGTEVELLGESAGFAAVEREFERLEALLSRFRDDSELSELNRVGRIRASRDLLTVVELALAARDRTGGLFDPTVHEALVAAGYDRSFELLGVAPAAGGALHPHHVEPPGDGGVHLHHFNCGTDVEVRASQIRLEPGTKLDLGGIAKGYTVDRAVELLASFGPALVNAGGDVAVQGGSWPVGVELPGETLTLALERGALATSGTDRRRWAGGHHLIDPRTARPADSPYLRVTVAAPSAVEAEVLAKALFLGADPEGATAVFVLHEGRVLRTGALA